MHIKNSLYTYLKSDLVALRRCFRIFFLRRMYRCSILIAPKRAVVARSGLSFPETLAKQHAGMGCCQEVSDMRTSSTYFFFVFLVPLLVDEVNEWTKNFVIVFRCILYSIIYRHVV